MTLLDDKITQLKAEVATARAVVAGTTTMPPTSPSELANALQGVVDGFAGGHVSVKQFGAVGDGVADDVVAIRLAGAQAIAQGKTLSFERRKYRLNSKVTLRGDHLRIEFNGAEFILGSSDAGFEIAGFAPEVVGDGAFFSQANPADTPLILKIFNDTTTPLSTMAKISGINADSVHRGILIYMGANGAGQACYRASIQNCRFENKHLQKTWPGSFGISFDGPNAGDAGGNDSRAFNCICTGYERNYVVNNSVATQLLNCAGDGAAAAISYEGASSGMQISGGYYEYNDVFLAVVGAQKYDAYIWAPSYGNNGAFISGAGIAYIGGSQSASAPYGTMHNGFFASLNDTGIAEVYGGNGLAIYSNNSKTVRATLDGAGDWTFSNGRMLFTPGFVFGTDSLQGYTGGATPLSISAGNKIRFSTAAATRGEFNTTQGLMLMPLASSAPAANGEMVFELTSNTSLKVKVQGSDGVVRSTTLMLA